MNQTGAEVPDVVFVQFLGLAHTQTHTQTHTNCPIYFGLMSPKSLF